jgi:Skp family chaperone for outer membrane proteins
MQSAKRNVNGFSVVLLLALCMVLGYQAFGRPAAQNRAPVVVTVDMTRLVDGLEQRQAAEADLKARSDRFEADQATRSQELADLKEQLKAIPETDKKAREELQDRYGRKAVKFQAWQQAQKEAFEIDTALQLRDIDNSIRAAIADLAEANGYDLVLTDDSAREITYNREAQVPGGVQVRQQMLSRRVLYVDRSVDVTNELIARMNNEFNAK